MAGDSQALNSVLQFRKAYANVGSMTEPLAIVLYERLMPGSQLVNRLQDLNYRVQVINDPALLVQFAEQSKPMLVLVDLESPSNVCGAISRLKQNPGTSHLPIIGFGMEPHPVLQEEARKAGVNLIANEAAILGHLPQLLDQALQID
jgi:CheY-like chemotaxis protein